MPNRLKRFLYAWLFYAVTYALVRWVTGIVLLALIAAVVSYVIAGYDWDWRQRRKAEREARDAS